MSQLTLTRATKAPPAARTVAVVLAVVAAAASVVTALADPGHGAQDGLALSGLVLRTTGHLAALGTIGCLVLVLAHQHDRSAPPDAVVLRSASVWASCWALVLLFTLILEVVAPDAVATHGSVGPDPADLAARIRWQIAGVVLACVVRILAGSARRRADVWLLLGVALVGLIPALAIGHTDTSESGRLVTAALTVHVVAVSVWAGGLMALVTHHREVWADGRGPRTVRVYSTVALACYVAVGASGLSAVLARTDPGAVLDSRAHLALLVSKAAILVGLGVAGGVQRRVVLPRLSERGPEVLIVVAVAEMVLMATALGLAVTLTHTAS